MKLSDCKVDAVVSRDGEFIRLGSYDADHEGLLAYADNLKYLKKALANDRLSCVITASDLAEHVPEHIGLMLAASPREAFYSVHQQFINESLYFYPFEPGIGSNCKIHSSAQIADGCRIEDNVTIGEHVVVRAPVWIGSHTLIEPGVRLGVEGILYNRTGNGPRMIPHGGYVRIHDNVMLMTNSIVVRSVHDTDLTEVGNSALIGLASIIGHEAKVGDRAIISNQCVVARRSIIGAGSFLGTQCMIKENVIIGKEAKVMAGSVVISDVPEGKEVSGNFAIDHHKKMIEFFRKNRIISTRD